jgi:colicin import membrane protein
LELDRKDAERRQDWAEQERHRALVREREQHEARLQAMREATLEKARLEAEARFERDRLDAVHAHELRMAELSGAGRVRRLRHTLVGTAVLCGLALAGGTALTVQARAETRALRAEVGEVRSTRASLDETRRQLHRFREKESLSTTELSRARAQLAVALQATVEPDARTALKRSAPAPVAPPRVAPRPVAAPRCAVGSNGDPLNGCIP